MVGPIQGTVQSLNAGEPHLKSAVTLAGGCSAFLGLFGGLPEKNGRLPICPIRITTTSTTYIR